ncbi:cystathionine gamma-synthase 1, chloroplastic, partial [Tanacetum coccineum]
AFYGGPKDQAEGSSIKSKANDVVQFEHAAPNVLSDSFSFLDSHLELFSDRLFGRKKYPAFWQRGKNVLARWEELEIVTYTERSGTREMDGCKRDGWLQKYHVDSCRLENDQRELWRIGSRATVIDPADYAGLEAALINNKVSLLFTESPTNPFLRCVDIELVSKLCHAHGAVVSIYGTFAPLNQSADFEP